MTSPRPDLMQSTSSAFRAMKRILFQPFDIKKWFVLGFTAWLAHLLEGGGSSPSFNYQDNNGGGSTPYDQQGNEAFLQWIQEHIGVIIAVASIVLIVGVAIYIVLAWVQSRGKFMFLDNVVHNRCQVKAPWHEFKQEGNSLFKWTLLLVAIFLGIMLILAGLTGWYVFGMIQSNTWTMGSTLSMIAAGLAMLAIALVWGYIQTMLENFVVPIMYRDRITATAAWKKFIPLHRAALGSFVLYFLWMMVLALGVLVVVALLGIGTCCIGFFLMAIPYLGAVILLPISVFFRYLGPDYLRQFGPEYDALAIAMPELPGSDESSHAAV